MVARSDLGPCIFHCGRDATHPKTQTCDSCYSYCRNWSNNKTPTERAQQITKLLLRTRRMDAIEAKLIVIGKSPHKWKATDKLKVVQFRKQRGGVR